LQGKSDSVMHVSFLLLPSTGFFPQIFSKVPFDSHASPTDLQMYPTIGTDLS
jgi:hypothetical protein